MIVSIQTKLTFRIEEIHAFGCILVAYLRSSPLQSVAMPSYECPLFHTWYSLTINDLAIQATSGLNSLERRMKSLVFPSFHGQLMLHQIFFDPPLAMHHF